MRVFSANKSKIPQIYNKIMKICQNTIRFILVENVERDIHENHWRHHHSEHISFSLQTSTIYIYISVEKKFHSGSTLQKKYALKFSIFQDMKCWTIAISSFFLTCCVLAKAKTIIHFQKEILKILNFTIGVTQLLRLIESMLKS